MPTILILRFSAMGDVAIAASVMKEVAAQNSETQFVFATQDFFAPLFAHIPNLVVFPINFTKNYKGITGLFRLYRDLNRNYKIDAIADLHNLFRSKLLKLCFRFSLKRIKIATINKGRKEKRALCQEYNLDKKPLVATWQRYAEVFQKLKLKIAIKFSPIPYFPEKIKKIGISPFAKHQGKVYPPELMEKVLELLSAKYEIYLFGGGKTEQEWGDKWQNRFNNVHSLIGKKKLEEELTSISHLDVMLSMDSSGMHLASLCKIPCISIWGATHPYSGFVGLGQENNPQIQLELPCRPCSVYGNKPCKYKDYRCLYRITPETIAKTFILT